MKFNKISIIISLLSYNLKVHSVPFYKNSLYSHFKRDITYELSENINDVDILKEEIYDTLPDDNIDVAIDVTDAVVDEEVDSDSDDEPIDTNECTSKECIEISKRILSSLDTSINPCDDFYEYSCGGWIEMNKNKRVGYEVFNEIEDKVVIDLNEVLEGNYKVNDKLSPKEKEYDEELFNATKNLYTACKSNYNKVNKNNENLVKYINELNITEAFTNRDKLAILFAELSILENNALFSIDRSHANGLPYKYIPSIKNMIFSTDNEIKLAYLEIELSKKGLSLVESFVEEDDHNKYIKEQNEKINNYKEYIRKVLKTIYGTNENKINTMVESINNVIHKLSQEDIDIWASGSPVPIKFIGTLNDEDNMETETMNYDDDDDYNNYPQEDNSEYTNILDEIYDDEELKLSIKEFEEKYPLVNWKLYFEKVFEDYGVNITEESIIGEDEYFKYSYKYLQEIDNKDLINYIEWNVINSLLETIYEMKIYTSIDVFKNIVSDELYQIREEYNKSLGDENEEYMKEHITEEDEEEFDRRMFKGNDTNSKCLNLIDEQMPLALSKFYVEMKFPDSTKSELMVMMENIRNSMLERIKKLVWLDESTRKHAIEKVLKIKYLLGYSDITMNVENIYNLYKPSFINKDDALSLLINLIVSLKSNIYKMIYNENISDNPYEILISDILNKSYIANAFYIPNENSMIFPASILQSPFFDVNQPDYINYGNLGSISGHELTHAFDNNGKNFDSDGKENNWWTDNDTEEFEEFSQCFVDQYSSFSFEIKGKKYYVDGENTLGENLSDNGGLDRAYEAWRNSIENNPEKAEKRNMKLPGLSDYTMDQLFFISYTHHYCSVGVDKLIIKNEHAPNKFRVNAVVSNNKRFAKTFNCPPNSPMNPDNKCTLW